MRMGWRRVAAGNFLQSVVASAASLIIVAPSRASDPRVAGVVELVDAPDSKSGSERSVGSIPTARTTFSSSMDGKTDYTLRAIDCLAPALFLGRVAQAA